MEPVCRVPLTAAPGRWWPVWPARLASGGRALDLTGIRAARGAPTARVATHGEPKRLDTVPSALLTGAGQARSRAEANMMREFWITMTIAALTMAAAMQSETNMPTPVLLQPLTMPIRSKL